MKNTSEMKNTLDGINITLDTRKKRLVSKQTKQSVKTEMI